MNKMLTAVAVSAVTAWAVGFSAIASAEATVYGRVVAGAVYSDNDDGDDDGAWNFGAVGIDGDNGFESSRFGFKGSTDLGNGLEAGFKIEREVEENDGTSQRHNNVYLSGGFGKVTLGNDSNPYMNARNWDQTNFYGGNWGLGSGYRHEGIKYSMSTGGFSLNVVALANDTYIDDVLGGKTLTEEDLVTFNSLCGTLCGTVDSATDVSADVSGNNGVDGWILHAGYNFGPVALNVAHQANGQDVEVIDATLVGAADSTQMEFRNTIIKVANNLVADGLASRDNTAFGVNGSAGPVDWYLSYQTSELNASGNIDDNDVDSIGGFLGFNLSESDVLYAYHVAHSADRETYGLNDDDEAVIALGEDYTETIFGYSRQIGPGVKFIAEYAEQDADLAEGGDTSLLFFAVKMDF